MASRIQSTSQISSSRWEERACLLASITTDEAKAAKLKSQLDSLQEEYEQVSRRIWQNRYCLAAVGVLPPEIMGEVFTYVASDNETAALLLTRPNAAALAKLYFDMSKACPLHVALMDSPADWKFSPPIALVEPFTELLREHWCRIRIFRIYRMGGRVARLFLEGCVPSEGAEPRCPTDPYENLDSSPSPSRSSSCQLHTFTKPAARHIALNLAQNHVLNQESDLADFRSLSNLFGDAQDVTTFTLENGIPSYDLPLFSSGKLKSIQIDEPHMFSYSTPVDRILDILASSPELHVFILAGNKSHHGPSAVTRRSTIHLPLLRIMSLQSIDIPVILDSITCPILEKLKLGNELGAAWDGCIAAALKGMVTRSNYPPITRLRINEIATPNPQTSSDWAAFEVLPQLQSFRCHHTHFPDRLLDELSTFPESDAAKGSILCPRLGKLVFENCDFSGDALVRFVRARRERARAMKDVVELQELWIGGCPNLGDEHISTLKKWMGPKFQSTLLMGP
ncbi:hypothetical protein FRB99_006029 [Tulasnella sp. 403]|nr:hypothetical protein FRB99_006029 [Tulasnella sp. 403]